MKLYQSKSEKMDLRICAPSEDLDQHAHLRSQIRIFAVRIWTDKDAKFLHADNGDSDQTARNRRLI